MLFTVLLIDNILNPIISLRLFQRPFGSGDCKNCQFSNTDCKIKKDKIDFKILSKADSEMIWKDYLNDPNPPLKFEDYNNVTKIHENNSKLKEFKSKD